MLTHADAPRPPAPIKVMLAANARRERVGLGPRYAQMRTLLASGKYVYHWVVVSPGGTTFSGSLSS